MDNLNWCFDAAAGLLLVGFIVQGVKKGFSKIIIPFVLNLVFLVLAFFMSGVIAGTLYESTIEDSVQMSVEEAVDHFDLNGNFNRVYTELTLINELSEKEISSVLSSEKDMDKKFWKLIDRTSGVGDSINDSACFSGLNSIIRVSLQDCLAEKLPPCAGKFFEGIDESNEEETYAILSMIHSDRRAAAEYISRTYVHDVMFRFVKMLAFVISSSVLMILTGIIFSIALRNSDSDPSGAGDRIAGAAVEIVNGIMVITVLAVLVKIIVYSGIQIDGIMDDKTLSSSYAFRFLYSIDQYMPGTRM